MGLKEGAARTLPAVQPETLRGPGGNPVRVEGVIDVRVGPAEMLGEPLVDRVYRAGEGTALDDMLDEVIPWIKDEIGAGRI